MLPYHLGVYERNDELIHDMQFLREVNPYFMNSKLVHGF
jgi:hypothetical protein